MLFPILPQLLLLLSMIITSVFSIPSPEEKPTTLITASSTSTTSDADTDRNGVDEECVLACSHWSVTMGFCRGQYNDFSQQRSVEYTNNFLSCLCTGTNSTGILGNEYMSSAASECLGCQTTPKKIKDDLGTFLGLCQVQQSNGTAWNATQFMPNRYSTSNDKSKDAVTGAAFGQYHPSWFTLLGMGLVILGSWIVV